MPFARICKIFRTLSRLPRINYAMKERNYAHNSDHILLLILALDVWREGRCTLESLQIFFNALQEHMDRCPIYDIMSMFLDLSVEKLTMGDCLDPGLVAAVINLNCARDWGCLDHFLHKHITLDLLPQPDIVNVSDGISCDIVSTVRVMCCMDWPFFKIFVRYGLVQDEISESEFCLSESINHKTLRIFLGSVTKATSNYNWDKDEHFYTGMASRNPILGDFYTQLSDVERRELLRIQTIGKVLRVLNCDSEPESQELRLKRVALYFESVTEPFVTASEIQRLVVEKFFRDRGDVLDESRLKQKLERYRELFPAIDVDVLQPRSLLHLSRCAVRSSLCGMPGTLPGLVSKLRLPCHLKDYILVAELDAEPDPDLMVPWLRYFGADPHTLLTRKN